MRPPKMGVANMNLHLQHFSENLQEADPRKFCLSKIWRYTVVVTQFVNICAKIMPLGHLHSAHLAI